MNHCPFCSFVNSVIMGAELGHDILRRFNYVSCIIYYSAIMIIESANNIHGEVKI